MNKLIYGKLLSDTIPGVVSNQKEYDRMEAIFTGLFKKDRSPEEDKLFELLANLLEDFEERKLKILPRQEPREYLRFLMDENGIRQADLADVLGTQSIVSDILSGKRQININQAKKLASRFNVNVELFV